MTIKLNLNKIITAIVAAVLAAIVIGNLVAVSAFGLAGWIGFMIVLPVLVGLGAASKVGNKKGGTQ